MAALIIQSRKVYVDQPATCVLEPLTLYRLSKAMLHPGAKNH